MAEVVSEWVMIAYNVRVMKIRGGAGRRWRREVGGWEVGGGVNVFRVKVD